MKSGDYSILWWNKAILSWIIYQSLIKHTTLGGNTDRLNTDNVPFGALHPQECKNVFSSTEKKNLTGTMLLKSA